MNETLGRPLSPRPKCSRSLSAALPTAPPTLALACLHVVRRKWMTFAARAWRHRRVERSVWAHAVGGEADHFGFGCFKAGPRYQLRLFEIKHLARTARRAFCFVAVGVGAM
jgi:hypothetical protein